jgi:hypothetical protein
MIQINLLPGAKRSKGGGGLPSINFAAIGAAIAARITDKWLAAAVIAGIAVGGGIVFFFMAQQTRSALLNSAAEKAVADSTRYAAVLNERVRLQARRDSALIQLNIIKAIDEERFIWPHVLQEVSEALPQYTWIQVLNYTGTAQGTNPPAAFKQPAPDTSAQGRRRPPRRAQALPEGFGARPPHRPHRGHPGDDAVHAQPRGFTLPRIGDAERVRDRRRERKRSHAVHARSAVHATGHHVPPSHAADALAEIGPWPSFPPTSAIS